jgi:predicted MPP superfamily phosphohydrolase
LSYGEIGCQEQYHFSESWKVVEEVDLLRDVKDKLEFKAVMIGVILATDMSRHMADLTSYKAMLAEEGGVKALLSDQ